MNGNYLIEDRSISSSRSLITLSGRITAANAGEIKTYLYELLNRGYKELVFDLSGITFLDSSGLAVFVSVLKNTQEAGGWLKLAALSEIPGNIFRLTCLDQVIDMYPSVESAIQSAG
ncbi:MAG: STAS domain-containing protein [Spirochaetales bacterium]|nr:STAS domain-containing protein [Spirochaetales bacterium]